MDDFTCEKTKGEWLSPKHQTTNLNEILCRHELIKVTFRTIFTLQPIYLCCRNETKVQVPKKKDINNKTPKKVRKWKEETVNNSGKN